MKAFRGILIVLAVATITSCATTRYSSGVTPEQVGVMALIEPISYMSYIQSTGKEEFDPETTAQSETLVKNLVLQNFPEITTVLPLDDYWDKQELENEISYLYSINAKKLEDYWAPVSIRRFLNDQGYRYGAAVFATGFTRDKKEYRRKVAMGALLSVITAIVSLGTATYYATPLKFSSSLYIIVVDAQEDKVIFYDKALPEEYNPLDAKKLNRRIALFRNHFK
jgi:hypothetical protein